MASLPFSFRKKKSIKIWFGLVEPFKSYCGNRQKKKKKINKDKTKSQTQLKTLSFGKIFFRADNNIYIYIYIYVCIYIYIYIFFYRFFFAYISLCRPPSKVVNLAVLHSRVGNDDSGESSATFLSKT